MKKIFFFFFLLLFCFGIVENSFAAIPKTTTIASPKDSLRANLKDRLAYFQKNPQRVNDLRALAFRETENFQVRWLAFSTLVELKPQGFDKDFVQAFKSPDWFMKDVALKNTDKLDRKIALEWSRKLVKDPSLIVRTTAVKNLARYQDTASEDLLWTELYEKQNFRKSQSLWVRKYIVSTLASFISKKTDVEKNALHNRFLKVLREEDKDLHASAVFALNQIHHKVANPQESVALQRERWLNWSTSL